MLACHSALCIHSRPSLLLSTYHDRVGHDRVGELRQGFSASHGIPGLSAPPHGGSTWSTLGNPGYARQLPYTNINATSDGEESCTSIERSLQRRYKLRIVSEPCRDD